MIKILYNNESEKWDEIVTSFKDYDVYYLSGYSKAFEINGDGQPMLLYYEDNNIKAINVVMKRNIPRKINDNSDEQLYDLTTPYGYGGFLIEGVITEESIAQLNKDYLQFSEENNIVSEFVRFNPILENANENRGTYEVVELGDTVTLNVEDADNIWSNITSKNRNVIRKAVKNEVQIYWGRSPELYDEFMSIYNKTMDYDDADDYYYFSPDFYKSINEDLKFNSLMFYAVYKEKIISMSIILFANNRMHYHLSGSDFENRKLAATNLLLYEAAMWGHYNGMKTFHLGGGLGAKKDSLYKFKKSFNKGKDTHFSIGKKILNEKEYFQLSKSVESDNEGFFPLYRSPRKN